MHFRRNAQSDDQRLNQIKKQLQQGQILELKDLAFYLGALDYRLRQVQEEIEETQERALDTIFLSLQNYIQKLISDNKLQDLVIDLYYDQDHENGELDENRHRMVAFDGTEDQAEDPDAIHFWQVTANFNRDRSILVQADTPLRTTRNRELLETLKQLLWTLNRIDLQAIIFHFFNLEEIAELGYFDEENIEDEEEEEEDQDTTQLSKSDLDNPYPITLRFTARRIKISYNNEVFLIFKYEDLAEMMQDRDDD